MAKGPVSEDTVGVLEITGGGVHGSQGIHALIGVGINAETVTEGGSVHELPHALGAYTRFGPGVEGALDDGHIFEFQRNVVAAESLFDEGEIVLGKPHHFRHLGGHLFRVQDHEILDRLVKGEGDEGIHLFQPAHEHGIGDIGGEDHGVHIKLLATRNAGLAMHVPLGEQGVGTGRCIVFQSGGNLVLVLSGEFFLYEFAVCGIGPVSGHLLFKDGNLFEELLVLFLEIPAAFPAL